jgi:hypothetical protein
MMNGAFYHESGPVVLWTRGSIISATIILSFLFLLIVALAVAGWAMIARHLASMPSAKMAKTLD